MQLLSYGAITGLLIGIIPGPISVLCFRRSIADGFLIGIATGLGASLTHLIFGSIAALGLTTIKNMFITQGVWLRLAGSIYLLYLAYHAVSNGISLQANEQSMSYIRAVISTFLLNITNPVAIISYTAFLTIFNLTITSITGGIQLLSGIFLGNFSVWVAISTACFYLRTRSSKQLLKWANRGTAFILATIGIFGTINTLYTLLFS